MVPSKKCKVERRNQFNLSNQVPASVPPVNTESKETPHKSPSLADLSPDIRGVINVLTDMKSTHCSIKGRSLMDPNFSLGQSAMSSIHQNNRTLSPTSSLSQSSHQGNSPTSSTNNDLYITKQRSMSLLGRVQHFPKPLKTKPASSSIINPAFFLTTRKVTISSPCHTAVTFESSATSSPSPTDPYLQPDVESSKNCS